MRIGVLLKDYKKEEGGAYSYYNALIESIADFKFSEDLEFVFIAIDNKIDKSAPEKSYLIDASKLINQRHPFLAFLNRVAQIKGIDYLPISRKIHSSYKKKYNKLIREELIKDKIEMVYSLTPFYSDLDYPTVITHWDIGHKSTYVLPEVIYNNEYESREWYYEKVLQKAFAIFCESETGKKELCSYKRINPERVFVIPMFPGNIIDLKLTAHEEQAVLERFNLTAKDFFIYPAQFWPHKNHYNLVVSFKTFNQKYPNVKLVLSGGDKGNLGYIKNIVKELGLSEHVLFPGFISNAELYTFYKNAISLVMPTLIGPTNMPPLEARQLGCRIICSDLPGHRESFGEGPIYVNPLDRRAIFEAMEKCYSEKETHIPDKIERVTITDALKQINQTFLSLSAIRKTFPLDINPFRVLMAVWLSYFHYI